MFSYLLEMMRVHFGQCQVEEHTQWFWEHGACPAANIRKLQGDQGALSLCGLIHVQFVPWELVRSRKYLLVAQGTVLESPHTGEI